MALAQEIIKEDKYIAELEKLREISLQIDPNVCLQCNKCVGSCTTAQVYTFRPARIMRYVALGMISHLIAGKEIWLCVQCLRCVDLCKMNVKPAEVIILLRNLATKFHELPTASWKRLIESVMKIGSMSEEVEQFAWKKTPVKRKDIGLAPLKFLPGEKLKMLLQIGEEI